MPKLTLSDGDQLHYDLRGDGPVLLLVSGLGGAASFWAAHVDALAAKFRVVLHDHRGTGDSSKPEIDYSVEQMTDDLVQLMDHLDIDKAHLVGHSTGGAIGQTLALDFPDRLDRMVLSATWPGKDDFFQRAFDVRHDILLNGGVEAYVRSHAIFMYPPPYIRDRLGELAGMEEEGIRAFPPVAVMCSRIRAIQKFDRRDALHRIAAPTFVMCARDDVVTPAYYTEELGRRIPGAETLILPDGGHFFPNVHPDIFQHQVLRFLSSTESNDS